MIRLQIETLGSFKCGLKGCEKAAKVLGVAFLACKTRVDFWAAAWGR